MFLIFGTKSVKKSVKGGLSLRRYCDRCRFLSDMGEYNFTPYFSVFFIPLFPIAKGESRIVCSRCGATFYSPTEDYQTDDGVSKERSESEVKTVITCIYCSGKLRAPVGTGRKLLVTCPHCRKRFDV
jgi:DNA-directed RNA polymerase subunit RPC12/RpoP